VGAGVDLHQNLEHKSVRNGVLSRKIWLLLLVTTLIVFRAGRCLEYQRAAAAGR
jgi:hypothetical protein